MTAAEAVIGVFEIVGLLLAVGFITTEMKRMPGRYLSWTPYMYGGSGGITIGVRRKGEYVKLRTLDPQSADFDDLLAEAQAAARERCVLLNSTDRAMARRLPS